MTVSLVSGCGGGASSNDALDVGLTTEVPAATGAVDALTWNVPDGEPATLDPTQAQVESVSTIEGNLCESLMSFDAEFGVQPGLAESMAHPDDLTYVFTLRSGATFWDGTPVTPADVVYSVQRNLDESVASSWVAIGNNLASVEATGPAEVTVRMSAVDALEPSFFATPGFAVVQQAYTEQAGPEFGTAEGGLMCSGPYQLGEWDQGSSIELTRYDGWWGPAPAVASIIFSFITDPSAQSSALISGDVDGQWSIPVSAITTLQRSEGSLLFGESLSPVFFNVLDQTRAFSDPAMRQAVAAAVDYAGIVSAVYRGAAEPLRALVPPAAYGYAEDVYGAAYDALPDATQDLDRAKELVAGSDQADTPIVLAYSTSSAEETQVATAVADDLRQAGITVELKPLTGEESNAIFSSAEARAGIDLFLATGYLDFPEPLEYYQYFSSGSFYNFTGYANPTYDDLLGQAVATEDPQARAELVVQAQQVITDDVINIPLVTRYVSVYLAPGYGGLVPTQAFLYRPWVADLGATS